MTRIVLNQMLGATEGAPGLLHDLNAAGYETARFGAFPDYSPPGYHRSFPEEPDAAVLIRAREWLGTRRASERPVFAFVHLKGGHAPVRTPGQTPSLRYQSAIASVWNALPDLVATFPPDWVTLISGDHGEALGEHGLLGHANSLYEELLDVPLLMRGHGALPGSNNEALGCPEVLGKLRRAVGRMPYTADQAPYRLALLNNGEGFPRDRQAALMIGRYKAIWNIGANTWELYDLKDDARERVDLSEARPAVMDSFVQAFRLARAAHKLD